MTFWLKLDWRVWKKLFELATKSELEASEYMRQLIERAAAENDQAPKSTPKECNCEYQSA